MDLTTAITSRHSTRAFTDEPVGRETITEIVALARRAPSWVDSQPWRVYAAIGAARERIARRHAESSTSGARGRSDIATMHRDQWASAQQRNMAGMSESLLALLGPDLERVTGEARASLFGAPALLYLTIPRAAPQWSLYDLGAFAQTLMCSPRAIGGWTRSPLTSWCATPRRPARRWAFPMTRSSSSAWPWAIAPMLSSTHSSPTAPRWSKS